MVNKITIERISWLKEEVQGKQFSLKKWAPPEDNKDWSHDHCEICNKELSAVEGAENSAYGDEKNFHWICTTCFEKHKEDLEL